MNWEIHAPSFTEMLVSMNKEFELPPVFITENGAALDDVQAVPQLAGQSSSLVQRPGCQGHRELADPRSQAGREQADFDALVEGVVTTGEAQTQPGNDVDIAHDKSLRTPPYPARAPLRDS